MRTHSYTRDPREITARFQSECPETHLPINKGDRCVYFPSTRTAYHIDSRSAQDWLRQRAADQLGLADAGW